MHLRTRSFREKVGAMNLSARLILNCILSLTLTASAADGRSQSSVKARHCLWKVEGRTNQVYLFGTIHLSSTNFFPLHKEIEDAYAHSQIVMCETDVLELSNEELSKIFERGKYPAGDSLKNHVSKEVYAKVQSYLERAGAKGTQFDSLMPCMAAFGVVIDAAKGFGFDVSKSVDQYFFARAKDDKKQIVALESYDSTFSRLAGLSEKAQETLLQESLREAESTTIIPAIAAAWKNGDTNEVEKYLVEHLRKNPELGQKILRERNMNWIDKIEKVIEGGTNAFIAVGAGHLVGKESLIDLLSKRGFRVTQM
jgi:uncharacterized protein YbaP (TraB family)